MKKSILNIGKTLNKAEQKNVNGGGSRGGCYTEADAKINCISPWTVIHGCYVCKIDHIHPIHPFYIE